MVMLTKILLWLAIVVISYVFIYRASIGVLGWLSAVPGIKRLVSVTVGKDTDSVKFSVGAAFAWSVSVNREKGTLTGSIQIDPSRRWGALGCIIAGLAAIGVPMVASLMMPAALIVVGVARARAGSSARVARGATAPPRSTNAG